MALARDGEEIRQADPLDGFDFPSSWLSFSYFLSIRDERATSWSPSHGFGLTGESGWVEVTREGVRWLGDRGLLGDLLGLYEEWCLLGRPTLDDYEVTFEPHVRVARNVASDSLRLDRRHFRQLVTVRRG